MTLKVQYASTLSTKVGCISTEFKCLFQNFPTFYNLTEKSEIGLGDSQTSVLCNIEKCKSFTAAKHFNFPQNYIKNVL